MTKLLEALVAHNTGLRVADYGPARWDISHDIDKVPGYSALYVYDVSATIRTKIVGKSRDVEDAKRKAWELVNHEVYGEFSNDLQVIRAALFERDVSGALAALTQLQERMFRL